MIDMTTPTITTDIAIIGSGMGGGTLAYALRNRGAKVLIVERGGYLPREPQNWSPRQIFVAKRYRTTDPFLDGDGKPFRPAIYYFVGGNTKVYGAALPRLRREDFGAIDHEGGVSPAWPISYDDLEPYYAEAEAIYRVHGKPGEDPTRGAALDARSRSRPSPMSRPSTSWPTASHARVCTRSTCRWASTCARAAPASGARPATASPARCWPRATPTSASRRPPSSPNVYAVDQSPRCRPPPTRAAGRSRGSKSTNGRAQARHRRTYVVAAARSTPPCCCCGRPTRTRMAWPTRPGLVGRNYMVHNNTALMADPPAARTRPSSRRPWPSTTSISTGRTSRIPMGNIQLLGKLQAGMLAASVPGPGPPSRRWPTAASTGG